MFTTSPGRTTSRRFSFTASKPGSTYLCSLDGTAFTTCASPRTFSGLSVGNHELKVKARDAFGNIQAVPTSKSFKVVGDTTSPKVIGIKFPKKSKIAKVKVRFKSNESGVTFTCKLNKAKARKCKAPWMTPKLKKGRNTIAIQATDEAGNKSKAVKRFIKRTARQK
ncbi:MAG: large repetitive protein [Actinomycetota bacterium]|nr:large repetitive protein [Actinomycetota bacterium]